jgi:hypothetical protein
MDRRLLVQVRNNLDWVLVREELADEEPVALWAEYPGDDAGAPPKRRARTRPATTDK